MAKTATHPPKLTEALKIITQAEHLSSDVISEFAASYAELTNNYTKLKETLSIYRQHKNKVIDIK